MQFLKKKNLLEPNSIDSILPTNVIKVCFLIASLLPYQAPLLISPVFY